MRGSPRVPATSRGAPFPSHSSREGILSLRGRERIPAVPVASQVEALSTGRRRGNPGSCHHSKSQPDVSVHSRESFFPCTASTFKPRIDSNHGGTWDSPVGKRRGKALWESLEGKHRSLDPREGKGDTAATALEESARACPHSRRGLTPLWRLQKYPRSISALERNSQVPAPTPHKVLSQRDTAATAREESARAGPHSRRGLTPLGRLRSTPRSMSAVERNPQVPAPTPHQVLDPGIDGRGIPRGPRATRMGTGLS